MKCDGYNLGEECKRSCVEIELAPRLFKINNLIMPVLKKHAECRIAAAR